MENTKTEWLTTVEVAELLRLSPRTIIRWRDLQIGPPHIMVGGSYRYSRRELETWIENRKRAE